MRAAAFLIAVAACGKHGSVVQHDRHAVAITVETRLPGASAPTMASAVTTPLERQFGQIRGLDRMESRSTSGTSTIVLEFAAGTEIDSAEMSVQASINAASNLLPRSLPAPPIYSKVGHEGAVLRLTLSGEMMAIDLTRAATRIAEKLSQVSGVGLVRMCGDIKDGWHVQVDPTALAGMGKTFEDLIDELRQPAADLDNRDTLPITREVSSLQHDGVRDPCVALDANGRVVVVTVQPQPGTDPEDVRTRLEAALPSLRAELPPIINFTVLPRARPLAFTLHFDPAFTTPRRLEVLRQVLTQLPAEALQPFVELGAHDPETAELRVVPKGDVEAAVIQRISMVPGVELRDRHDHIVGLSGPDPAALRTELDKLATALRTDKALTVVETIGTKVAPDLNVKIDRDTASRLGVTADTIDRTLAASFGGMQVTTKFTQLDQLPVMLSLRDDERGPEVLSKIYARSTTGTMVPLSTFTSLAEASTPTEELHVGQFPWLGMRVSGSLDELQAALAKSPVPADMRRDISEPR
jgi:multidrug efflux pump subunit AcrB